MISRLVATAPDPTVPDPTVPAPSAPEATLPPVPESAGEAVDSTADVIGTVIDNLGSNGYQTGLSLVVATAAVVAMINLKVHRSVIVPVAIGAFWAGWLGWNTLTGEDNPLFPGDVSATKLWDVGLTSDSGFLLVVVVACVAAVFLWRKGIAVASRIMLLLGAVLGASFVYNLVQAVRDA